MTGTSLAKPCFEPAKLQLWLANSYLVHHLAAYTRILSDDSPSAQVSRSTRA